jgi:hypothetical protein
MADLFLSYAHEDTERAQTLAGLLEDAGLTVWWDPQMGAGDKIHDVVDEQIKNAKAVIVLWSPISVKSDWVRGEAQTAHELGKLVPIKIAKCQLPINYRGIHTPEVYKSKSELNKLARLLSDKFRTVQASGATPSADFPHPALGQDITPSPTARRAQAQSGGRARSTRRPNRASEIKFTANSSDDFLRKLEAQTRAYQQELPDDWFSLKAWSVMKKYPIGATWTIASGIIALVAFWGALFSLPWILETLGLNWWPVSK